MLRPRPHSFSVCQPGFPLYTAPQFPHSAPPSPRGPPSHALLGPPYAAPTFSNPSSPSHLPLNFLPSPPFPHPGPGPHSWDEAGWAGAPQIVITGAEGGEPEEAGRGGLYRSNSQSSLVSSCSADTANTADLFEMICQLEADQEGVEADQLEQLEIDNLLIQ